MSSSVIFHHCLTVPLPFPSFAAPVQSRAVAPEFIRCIIPFAALPVSSFPVTRLTASGDQYVRTSWKHGALPVSKVANSIEIPFNVSFSVAKANGAFFPFQSNEDAIIASVKSPLGSQSVHIL